MLIAWRPAHGVADARKCTFPCRGGPGVGRGGRGGPPAPGGGPAMRTCVAALTMCPHDGGGNGAVPWFDAPSDGNPSSTAPSPTAYGRAVHCQVGWCMMVRAPEKDV